MSPLQILPFTLPLLPIMLCGAIYNRLSRRRNQVENAKSSLDALFIKRNDLIPNLVTTVKQYTQYEDGILEKVVSLRNAGSRALTEYEQDGEMARFMKSLLVQVENYPQLRASEQFTHLQYSWNEAEEQIAAGRRYLSGSITQYNNSVQTFPSNLLAGLFGFKEHAWERASATQKNAPDAHGLFTR